MSSSYDVDSDELAVAVAAHAAKLAEIAGTSGSPNAKYRHRIDDAARIIAMRIGVSFSPESLRKSAIRRVYVGRNALFSEEDLHAFADARLDRAGPPHEGPRSLKRRAPRREDGEPEMAPEPASVSAQ
jgi:hypothetical protein